MASPILESAAPDDVTGAALVVLRRPRGIRIPGAIWIGGSLLGAMILICFVGPLFDHANETNAQQALLSSFPNAAPSSAHLFGTDGTGFDVFGRIMVGGRTSLIVGFAAAALGSLIGGIWGITAGLVRPSVDNAMMRVVDIILSVPILYLLIVLAVVFRPSLILLILIIGGTSWVAMARFVRAETLSVRERDYVEAARSIGAGNLHIAIHHIVPNTIGTITVNAVFQVADAILVLAALGFVGLGVQPPATDWGSMLTSGVTYAVDGYWWEVYPVGVAIIVVVVSLNLIGEGIADRLGARR
jgi:peptide/nickel transport system permease protein